MIVCLDYGHRNNIYDFGATNGSVKESELALSIGKKIKVQLERNNISVIETRKSENEIVSLGDRCSIANNNKANFFLSVHINSAENLSANGVEVLHYKGIENRDAAQCMSDMICKYTGAKNRGAKVRTDLAVLNGTKMSALLVECGFLSSVDECKKLQNESYQDNIVRGIIESMECKYYEVDKPKEKDILYRVVCGSYSNRENADKMMKELEERGYKPFIDIYEK